MAVMRSSALLLTLLLLAACGGDSSPPPLSQPDGGTGATTFPSACTNDLGTSALLTGVHPLGTHTVGENLTFVVPADTVSITIVEQAVSAPVSITLQAQPAQEIGNTPVPLTVTDANLSSVFDGRASRPNVPIDTLPAFFASSLATSGTGTLTIPNTSAALSAVEQAGALVPGPWSLQVSDFAYECATGVFTAPSVPCAGSSNQSTYDVTVITRQAVGGLPPSGVLDVEFYFATTSAPSPVGDAG
jgi:hypothetical protein